MTQTIPNRLEAGELAVSTESLVKRYGGKMVLDHLDLTVPVGAFYALIGPNGAGKTTTLEILLDLVRPDAGQVSVFGMQVHTAGPRVRAHIGYLPERHDFGYPQLTVEQLLEHHGAYYSEWDERYAQQLARALSIPCRSSFGALSKGESRRVQLVMALAHRPPLLLLDEMMDGLDPLARDQILGIIAEHMSTAPTTVLLSTHYIQTVERFVDTVGLIRNGRMIAQVGRDDLRRRLCRYRGQVPKDWPGAPDLDGAAVQRTMDGRQISWVIWGDEADVVTRLKNSGAQVDDVSPLALDEATLTLLRQEEWQS